MKKISAIILAAGRSTRMKSALPKVLHDICGRPVVSHTIDAAKEAQIDDVVLVVSSEFKGEMKGVALAVQKEQLGTADAARSALPLVKKDSEYALIIPGDVPLVHTQTLRGLIDETTSSQAAVGLISMIMDDPASYGRIVRNKAGNISSIVEKKDATKDELNIKEVNSGIYCAKTAWLKDALSRISPKNAQKEYYLTDIVKIATTEKQKVVGFSVADANEVMGVNTREELARASAIMRSRVASRLMAEGVGIIDPKATYIDSTALIGQDTIIHPNCMITGKTSIGRNCTIEAGVIIRDSAIADNVHVKPYSVIEDSEIGSGAVVGPFARLRPKAVLEDNVKIGNFVEVKKSRFKKDSKASHLSYIGDATIGERTNIGCGTITCNYDGKNKHQTVIEDDVMVGSDVQFVAPVRIGRGVTIGAGSTITGDVPEGSLAIARSRQVVKRGWKPKK